MLKLINSKNITTFNGFQKNILLLTILLVTVITLSACVTPPEPVVQEEIVEEPEIIEEEVMEEKEETVEEPERSEEVVAEKEEEMPEGFYNFWEGETREVLGRTITVEKMYQEAEADLLVDGVEGSVLNTKEDQIINGLRISIDTFQFESEDEHFLTLKVEELVLEENQYLITKQERITFGDKDVFLEESKSNGFINIAVYDIGSINGVSDQKIASGDTEKIYGVSVTNVENFYLTTEYAIIQIE